MGLFQGDPKMQQVFPFPEGKFHFLVKGHCGNVLIINNKINKNNK